MTVTKKRGKTCALRIEKLPEGVFLATSKDIPGLVVQEDTFGQTIETVCEVAGVLLELNEKLKQKAKARKYAVAPRMPATIPLRVTWG